MTKKKINYLLVSFLIVLIVGLGALRFGNPKKLNYYKLNESFYLNKVDYFSSYTISTFKNNDYQDIIKKVKEIAISEDNIMVCFEREGAMHYATLKTDSIFYNQINTSNLNFVKPSKIVEQSTLNSNYRLLNQVLIIGIVLLGFYLIMRIFNIKRLTKS